jgi:ArsR family transcriptional regulator
VDDSTSVELTALRLRALGDPTRLAVVHLLRGGTACVCELRQATGVGGPLLSHHLAVLRDAGLVSAARRGRWVDYTLEREVLDGVVASLAAADLVGAS